MQLGLLLFISILPVVLLGKFIYNHDKNKESKSLLTRLFISGILSIALTLILTGISEAIFPLLGEDPEKLNKIDLIANVFLGVAFIEEFSKWIMVKINAYNHKDFDEVYDAIVYTVFVSLGFACLENILYVVSGGLVTGIFRALLAVPGHACDGVIMGYYIGLAKAAQIKGEKSKESKYLFLSILCPTLAHGFYDYCLMTEDILFILLFFIFVIILFIKCFITVKKIAKSNRNMVTNQPAEYIQPTVNQPNNQPTITVERKFCPNCGAKVETVYCPHCGTKNK